MKKNIVIFKTDESFNYGSCETRTIIEPHGFYISLGNLNSFGVPKVLYETFEPYGIVGDDYAKDPFNYDLNLKEKLEEWLEQFPNNNELAEFVYILDRQ